MKKLITAAFLALAIGAISPAFAAGAFFAPASKTSVPASIILKNLLDHGNSAFVEQARRSCTTKCVYSGTAGSTPQYCYKVCR